MRRALLLLMAIALGVAGCEDGPEQVFEENGVDPDQQNGEGERSPYVTPGTKPIELPECDATQLGEARFCCEQEHEAVVQDMVKKPIIPGESLGGVPIWSADGPPTHADSLVGRPEAGRFCDPTVYSNALTWGPTNEIIAFINTETRIIESIYATDQYLGTLEGTYETRDESGNPTEGSMVAELRQRLVLNGQELDEFASSTDQASKPNSWLNHDNVNEIHRFIRTNYFGDSADDFAADYNCIDDGACNIIYTSQSAGPQDTLVYLTDSGFILYFGPEGHLNLIIVEPVVVNPFTNPQVDLGDGGEDDTIGTLAPTITTDACTLNLAERPTWGWIKSNCIGDQAEEVLKRFTFDVSSQRDAVSVDFNGLSLSFLHVAENDILEDGQKPDDDDILYYSTVTRQISAPVQEFRQLTLANIWKEKLEERIRNSIRLPEKGEEPEPEPEAEGAGGAGGAGGDEPVNEEPTPEPARAHPFLEWELTVPADLSDDPQPMDRILVDGVVWQEQVARELMSLYQTLTPEEQAAVDPKVLEPTWQVEAFVSGVLEQFTHNRTRQNHAYVFFENTDDKNWVIGTLRVMQDGVPYRITAQYSMSYGAVTAMNVGVGGSRIDEIYDAWNAEARPDPADARRTKTPFYSIDLAQLAPNQNPLALGGEGIEFVDFDRHLSIITVKVALPGGDPVEIKVPGSHPDDRGGFSRQLRGARFEFIPAYGVQLNGKETSMLYYVEKVIKESPRREVYEIARVSMGGYKGSLELCPGLEITFGDYLVEEIESWRASAGLQAYRDCEIVFNWSENGNVLDSVVSLANRISFTAYNGRSGAVALWR